MLTETLFSLQNIAYKEFHQKLIPTVSPDCVIGVRTPSLRKFAKEFAKTDAAAGFLKTLPHKYYEENNLHAFVIERTEDFSAALAQTEQFLPYIDNWATCDMFFPKVFEKHPKEILVKIKEWMHSDKPYTVRYAIGLLMRMFLDERFSAEYLDMVADIRSEEYYINMMIAWYFATALTKQYKAALPYIEKQRLAPWVHNKAIQKAIESRRIPQNIKKYLKGLKIKG